MNPRIMQKIKELPNWSKILIGIVVASIAWSYIADAMQSPDQKAIRNCTSMLNKAASGSLSHGELERMCILMRQRGEI